MEDEEYERRIGEKYKGKKYYLCVTCLEVYTDLIGVSICQNCGCRTFIEVEATGKAIRR